MAGGLFPLEPADGRAREDALAVRRVRAVHGLRPLQNGAGRPPDGDRGHAAHAVLHAVRLSGHDLLHLQDQEPVPHGGIQGGEPERARGRLGAARHLLGGGPRCGRVERRGRRELRHVRALPEPGDAFVDRHDLAGRLRGRGLPAVRAVRLLLEPGVRGHDVPAQPVQHDGPDDPHERGGRAAGRAVDRQGAAGAAPAGGRAGRRGGAGHAEDVRDRPELRLADHARRRLPGPGGRGAVVALLLRQPERPGARTDGGRAAGLRLRGPAGDGGHALLPRDRPVQPGAGRQRGGDRRPRRGRARAGRAGLHARYSGGPRTAGRHRPVDREDHGPRLDAHGLPEPVQAGPRRADAVRDQLPAAQPAARADGDGHSGQPRGRAHVERRCGDGERSVLPDRGAARDPRLPGAGLRGLPGLPQGAAERGLGVDRAVRPQERRDRGGHGHGQRDHGGRRRRDRRGHGARGDRHRPPVLADRPRRPVPGPVRRDGPHERRDVLLHRHGVRPQFGIRAGRQLARVGAAPERADAGGGRRGRDAACAGLEPVAGDLHAPHAGLR